MQERATETTKQHYQKQLEQLHNMLWELECYHVNELNRSNNQRIKWTDCGTMNHILVELNEIICFAKGKED